MELFPSRAGLQASSPQGGRVAAAPLRLTFAIADYPHTAALKNGAIGFEGIEPHFADVKPQIAAFRRMVRQGGFRRWRIAPPHHTISRPPQAPFLGPPSFVLRRLSPFGPPGRA